MKRKMLLVTRLTAWVLLAAISICVARAEAPGVDLAKLRNPVWASKDNLRDPSVLKTPQGCLVFYSRFSGGDWSKPAAWAVACASTKDFVRFENDRDVTAKGFASPGDVIQWHGRWLLPYQSYPASPNRLCFSESADLREWSTPRYFLDEARDLPWNGLHRLIDPTFVVDGDTLHCFFVGSAMVSRPLLPKAAQTTPGKSGLPKPVRANLMGHAVTRDPKLEKWEILTRTEPMLGVSQDAPDGVENTMVFKTGGHWTMIYSEGLAAQHLALATSQDLVKWKREGPIEIERQGWNARKFGAPFVWRDGERWLMILMGTDAKDRTTFGLLSSADGRNWKMLPEK